MNDEHIVDTLIKLAEQQVHNVLLVLRQPLMPSWVIIDKDGQPHIRATPWRSDREKALAAIFLKLQIRARKAQAYSFVTEAWAAEAPEGFDDINTPLAAKDRPMNRADRREVVIAFATDGHRSEWRQWLIRRDWNGRIITLEPAHDIDKPEGWIAELLPQKNT